MNDKITFIDLFSGIGGFRLGLERNEGYQCVWSCDFNKYANQVYTKQFGEANHHSGDIRRVDPRGIPDFDLLCAGFPCQAFSVAGKRKGFQDTRGTLFFEILRVAGAKRPALLLLENVKGLLSHDRGRTLAIILKSLEGVGYWWEYQVLNSKHFGVPQNRERVFIVGHLRGAGGREIFPITEASEFVDVGISKEQVASALQSPGHASGNYRGMNMILEELPERVRGVITRWQKHENKEWLSSKRGKLDLPINGEKIIQLANRTAGGSAWRKEVPTLDGSSGSIGYIDKHRVRRLTPIECERLQGFPDNWTEGISDTQRYKCLGNAVTVNVIEFLGHQIRSSFQTTIYKENTNKDLS